MAWRQARDPYKPRRPLPASGLSYEAPFRATNRAMTADRGADECAAAGTIVQHQKAIGLTDTQRTALIGEVKRVQNRMIDLQWDLQRAVERMSELIGQDKVDEAAALEQLDNVLAVEREIKRAHIVLAARLKNLLTPEQQRALRELRAASATPRR
jgi:Spy/CpxP family protein refolding chaperone